MFHQKHYHTHGMLFFVSLILAFILGRKSERYGLTIVSRGCGCYEDDDEMEIMSDSTPTNSYPQ
ncbi:hypothetical protein [Desulfosporosinus hippei]|uniref:Uncharacterized protein n=1 Tax=Desulfosporosinus hippei DSM 8344 TaxID=1121419 RepID=A0A1G7Z955_9FIRM|nr:hypothetical protein [Desulfosporosinus hippei]SDH05139.1 hypothetical protein SAMN05443529_10943 [Desulfosporosinus hippei DSM 8344]